jgi:hypothetical protein
VPTPESSGQNHLFFINFLDIMKTKASKSNVTASGEKSKHLRRSLEGLGALWGHPWDFLMGLGLVLGSRDPGVVLGGLEAIQNSSRVQTIFVIQKPTLHVNQVAPGSDTRRSLAIVEPIWGGKQLPDTVHFNWFREHSCF